MSTIANLLCLFGVCIWVFSWYTYDRFITKDIQYDKLSIDDLIISKKYILSSVICHIIIGSTFMIANFLHILVVDELWLKMFSGIVTLLLFLSTVKYINLYRQYTGE